MVTPFLGWWGRCSYSTKQSYMYKFTFFLDRVQIRYRFYNSPPPLHTREESYMVLYSFNKCPSIIHDPLPPPPQKKAPPPMIISYPSLLPTTEEQAPSPDRVMLTV